MHPERYVEAVFGDESGPRGVVDDGEDPSSDDPAAPSLPEGEQYGEDVGEDSGAGIQREVYDGTDSRPSAEADAQRQGAEQSEEADQ